MATKKKNNALAGYIPANTQMPNPNENATITKPFTLTFFEYLFLRGESVLKQGNTNLGSTTFYTVPENTTLLLFSFDLSLVMDGAVSSTGESELRIIGAGGGIEARLTRIRACSDSNLNAPTAVIGHDLLAPIPIKAGKSISVNGTNANGTTRCTIFGILIPNNLL